MIKLSWQYKPLEERIKKPGFLETVGRDVVGGLAQLAGYAGQVGNQIHLGGLQALDDYFGEYHPNLRKPFEAGRRIGKSLEDWGTDFKSAIPDRPEFKNRDWLDLATDTNYLTSPYGLWHDAWQGLTSSLPFMGVGGALVKAGFAPASFIGGKATNLLGKTQVGQKLLDFGNRAYNTRVGGVLGDMISGGANYGLTTAPMDAMLNSAELIQPLKDRGFSDSDIAKLMGKAALRELPMDIAANALQGNILFGKGLGLAGKTWKGRLGYGSLNIPLEMGTEYFQEGNQEANIRKFLGLPYTENPIANFLKNGKAFEYPEERDAANAGAFGSIIPSAGGTVHHALFGKDIAAQPAQDTPTSTSSGNNNLLDWVHQQGKVTDKDETVNKIIAEAQRQGVDPKLALANGIIESSLNQNDISEAGAIGVMQLMPETARSLGVDPYNEDENIRGGIQFLKDNLNRFNGDWRLAFAAYNAGRGAVEKFGGIPPYRETQNHVRKFEDLLGANYSSNSTHLRR